MSLPRQISPSPLGPPVVAPVGRRVAGRAPSARRGFDPLRISILLLVALSISKLGGYVAILRVLRPAFLLFGFSVVYVMLNPRRLAGADLFRFATPRLLVALGLVACGSAVFGISMGSSASFIIKEYWKTLALGFLMMGTMRTTGDLRQLMWATGLGGVILAWLSIFVFGISKTSSGVAYDANDVGLIMLTCLPIMLLAFQTSTGKLKLFTVVGIALIMVTIGKTQSRGAFLALLCVGICMLFMLPGIAITKRIAFVAITGLIMFVAMPAEYRKSMTSLAENPESDYNFNSVDGRVNIWKRGIGYMLDFPVFGVGINNFGRAEGTISDKAKNAPVNKGIWWNAPHNSYVEAGAETGITGLAIWVSMIGTGLIVLRRIRRRLPKHWRLEGTPDQRFLYYATIYLPIAYVGFATAGFFVSFAWLEPFYILAALVVGVQVAYRREMPQQPRRGTQPFRRTARVAPPAPTHP